MTNPSILAAFERMWQHIVAKIGTKADISHNHDDVYYTEVEVDEKLEGKADTSHAHTVSNITDLTVTATELNYMDGATSNIQTQFDNVNNKLQDVVYSDESDEHISSAPINADTLGGRPADEYALNSELQNYALNSDLQNYALSSELTEQIDIVNEKIPTTAEQVGAAPTTHEHSAENITSGVLSPTHGGTGYTSITDTTYTTARYRASSLHSAETTPTTNGVIAWTYE
jgi:hypothetical protein